MKSGRIRTAVLVRGSLPGPQTRPAAPAQCRCCGMVSYRADDHGGAHECCLAWPRVTGFGYPCPACQIARVIARTGRVPGWLPPLPDRLPDGTPFVPDPPPVPLCAACGHVMTVIVPGQRCHPLCAADWAGTRRLAATTGHAGGHRRALAGDRNGPGVMPAAGTIAVRSA